MQWYQFYKNLNSDADASALFDRIVADKNITVKIKIVSDDGVNYGTSYGLGTDPNYHRIDLDDVQATAEAHPTIGPILAKSAFYHELFEAYEEFKAAKTKTCPVNSDAAKARHKAAHGLALKQEARINKKYGIGARGEPIQVADYYKHPSVRVQYGTYPNAFNVQYTTGIQPINVRIP